MTELNDLYEIAQGYIDYYQPRNTTYKNVDDMVYKRWNMPEGMPGWVMKVVSTDPADAVLTATRTFSTVKPTFKVMPMLPNEANRNRANEIETAIAYNFKQAGRRNDASVVWDVMWSATMYGEVAAQVIYLPYQEKILEAMGKDTRRLKATKRFGDFAFIIHNPANVYPTFSEYGLEEVMTVRVQTVDEFKSTWGKQATKVFRDMGNGYSEASEEDFDYGSATYVTSFDLYNYEKRIVWAVCGETSDVMTSGKGIKILEEDNKLGFIPYAIKRWGNSLSVNSEERVMPLLQSVWDSGQWDMLNVFESLDASLTMKRASQPQWAGEFPAGQEPRIDNTEPSGTLDLPAGTRNFTPLPSQSVDSRLSQEKTQFKAGIWQSTVSRILQTLEFPSGTAYSSVNQLLSQATSSLAPYRLLGESSLAEVAHQMLCWVKYYGKEYTKVDLYGQYDSKSRMGEEVRISSDTIDPDALQIEVTLTADMPIDKLQLINGAVLMKNNFSIPEAELIEDLGYGDASELNKRRKLEDYQNAYIQLDIKRMADAQQLETQQAQMQMQMQAQQAAQEQQMQAQQAAQQQAQAQANASPANENLGGSGFNPASGGTPPVQGNRGQQ